jgi:hypothetical protein
MPVKVPLATARKRIQRHKPGRVVLHLTFR